MTNICNIIVSNFIAVIVVLWVIFSICYPDQIPTFTFTAITAGFAYQAYKYTKEKFRLELFEKRWEVYEAVVNYNSIFLAFGGLNQNKNEMEYTSEREPTWRDKKIEEAHDLAHQIFRGQGWHTSRLLFGEDIQEKFRELNDIYCQSSTGIGDAASKGKIFQSMYEITKGLPEFFKPYLYFGDYKSNMQQENNLCELCVLCGEKFKNLLGVKSQKGQT